MKMDIVVKIAPINDFSNKKKTSYYISDNLSLFYYRYIFIYSSQIKMMNPDVFYSKYIEKDFEEQYVPHQFEQICKEYLIRNNKNYELDTIFTQIGKYYYDNRKNHTNGEFDIVTFDENGYVFYEVKFRKNPITDSIIDEEIKQVDACGLKCYKYVFISKSEFEAKPRDNVQFITLNEIYKY